MTFRFFHRAHRRRVHRNPEDVMRVFWRTLERMMRR
jgi:hypothetical protein